MSSVFSCKVRCAHVMHAQPKSQDARAAQPVALCSAHTVLRTSDCHCSKSARNFSIFASASRSCFVNASISPCLLATVPSRLRSRLCNSSSSSISWALCQAKAQHQPSLRSLGPRPHVQGSNSDIVIPWSCRCSDQMQAWWGGSSQGAKGKEVPTVRSSC